MSEDFWNVNLCHMDHFQLRKFEFLLAERLIRGVENVHKIEKVVSHERFMESGRRARSPIERTVYLGNTMSHLSMLDIEILTIEVSRHYAEGQKTPPHLAASFLDECMATLGEVHEPVTQLWLGARGFDSTDTTYQGMAMILPEPSGEPRNRFAFDISPETRTAHRWMIYSGYGCEYAHLLGIGPTAAQVLTVGRALGIPTERKS